MKKKFKLISLSLLSLGLMSCETGFFTTTATNDVNVKTNNSTKTDDNKKETTVENNNTGGKENTNENQGGSGNTESNPQQETDVETPINDQDNLLVNLTFNVEGKEASRDEFFENNTKPVYEGETPTKEHPDSNKVYKFVGWSTNPNDTVGKPIEELPALHGSATYHAIFEEKDAIELNFYSGSKVGKKDVGSFTSQGNSTYKISDEYLLCRKKFALGEAPVFDEKIEDFRIDDHTTAVFTGITLYEFSGTATFKTKTTNISHEEGKPLVLPTIPENLESNFLAEEDDWGNRSLSECYYYVLNFESVIDECKVYFKNGNEYLDPERGRYDENGIPYLKAVYNYKPSTFLWYAGDAWCTKLPVKIEGTKKYEFVGWSTNPNASPTGNEIFFEKKLNSTTYSNETYPKITQDTTFYAIFSNVGSDVFAYTRDVYGNEKYLTKNEAKQMNMLFIFENDSKLSISNQSIDMGNYVDIQLFLDDSITSLGNVGAKCLTRIYLSNKITDISNAFSFNPQTESPKLEYVKLGTGIKTIGENAFKGCESLICVDGASNVTSIGASAFEGCKNLKTIDTSNVESIGAKGFYGSPYVKYNFPNLKTLGAGAFSYALENKEVTLPTTINTYGENGPFANSLVSKLTIPSNVTKLETSSIANCPNLKEVVFKGNTTLEGNPFYGSNEIEKFTFNSSSSYKSVGGQLISKNGVLIHASNNVEEIDSSVKTIQAKAIYNTSIETLKIPKSVTTIEDQAIESDITTIKYNGTLSAFNSALKGNNSIKSSTSGKKINVICSNGTKTI